MDLNNNFFIEIEKNIKKLKSKKFKNEEKEQLNLLIEKTENLIEKIYNKLKPSFLKENTKEMNKKNSIILWKKIEELNSNLFLNEKENLKENLKEKENENLKRWYKIKFADCYENELDELRKEYELNNKQIEFLIESIEFGVTIFEDFDKEI
ncbi:ribosome assembly protein [Anaeramoeba ignava]|uniref:Ribosome assembly protein n=1 Tax=Anaeramoeba ignava TaxID=1746090 RepID=A0A9Q0RF07_ANAIG|nr:ribosome assembly protein [Anaeramoeba ignava]